MTHPPSSGIRDNRSRGRAADFLCSNIAPGAGISFVSAYFTIYGYEALHAELDHIAHLGSSSANHASFTASEQPSEKTDFELVSWLVLLPS